MTLRCLIVDDEPLAHEVILEYCRDVPFISIVGQCYRATEALEFLNNNAVDLLFLDIRMPRLSGLDLIKTLTHKPMVIITSAYGEYALESFDLAVCDYLLKPFKFERFLKAVNRAAHLKALGTEAIIKQAPYPATLTLKVDKRHVVITVGDITTLESLGNYVKVWRGNELLLTQRTLSSFEAELDGDMFVRTHKSHIVNKAAVKFIEGNRIMMNTGAEVPIGKNYRSDILSRL
ncbi:MAG: response regulator transcription factor [Sphingobacteriales bacterium]|nr:MAG: response regulator transcription factor [Sphingobacteriales bacterium]